MQGHPESAERPDAGASRRLGSVRGFLSSEDEVKWRRVATFGQITRAKRARTWDAAFSGTWVWLGVVTMMAMVAGCELCPGFRL